MVIERCWHGRFTDTPCSELGLYGCAAHRLAGRPAPAETLSFMRAARWCLAHRHPGDVLLKPGLSKRREDGKKP